MPWCPICRTEYREGFTVCSDCNSTLVEEFEQEKEVYTVYDHEVYLTTVSDEIEADVIESLLTSNNIPVLRKYRGTGAYLRIYMGNTSFGIDIYVPSKLLEESKELINAREAEIEYPEIPAPSEEGTDIFIEASVKIQKKRALRAWIILLFFFPSVISIVISLILNIWKLVVR